MDVGLLILRLLVAGILFAHATQKLYGWFNGPGMDATAALFEKLGQRPGRSRAQLAVVCELAASMLLLLGLAFPLGAAIAAGTMFVAGSALSMLNRTVWNAQGGGEYPYILGGVALVLGFTGPGVYSLDQALTFLPWSGLLRENALLIGAATALLAVITALPPIAASRTAYKIAR